MGLLKSAVVVAALVFTGPVWAHGGHGHDRDRDHRGWERHHQPPARGHYRHHHRDWDRAPRQAYVEPYYYAPAPAYGYVAPAPGVHVVTPDIFIRFR